MAEKFVPVLSLTRFTGSNQDDLPLSAYVDAYGPGTGAVSVENGVLSITWPPQYAAPPVTVQTGDWVDEAGMIYPAATVEASYVRLSDLGALL